LEELRSEDLGAVGDADLEVDVLEIEREAGVLLGELCRRVAEVDRRRSYVADNYLSTTSWLAHRAKLSPADASRRVRLARALRDMPRASEALAHGEISTSAVHVLARAGERCPEQYPEAEEMLVDMARDLDVRDLTRAVEYWKQVTDPREADDRDRRRHELRRLHASATLDGMVRIDGDLDPHTGQTVLTALHAVMDAEIRSGDGDEPRTTIQRRADALGVIARYYLDSAQRPTVAGERPHVSVLVDLETLEGRTGYRCELSDAGTITPEMVRMWCCDARVSRVVTSGRSEPLDVGRLTSTVPKAMRRAVTVRDGGCSVPGCGAPARWCDCHHVRHWADGGPTELRNLAMLCRRHHRAVHDERLSVDMSTGRPVFRRPDGSVLDDRRRIPDRAPP
ncbi:MAG: HNH endonuclease, partial [Actinomycetota bacterium]|nr:HNH endonuclease [Actinomycetota bacterium]